MQLRWPEQKRRGALAASGSVKCWGSAYSPPLAGEPGAVDITPILDVRHAVLLAVGAAAACAIDDVGELYCWGRLVSDGSASVYSRDATAMKMEVEPVKDVSVGLSTICAVTVGGAVTCWDNLSALTSVDDPNVFGPATRVVDVDDVMDVAVGMLSACARDGEGATWCWGNNKVGSLGTSGDVSSSDTPVAVTGLGATETR